MAVAPRAAATAAAAAQITAQTQVPVVLGNSQRRSRPMSWGWRVTDIDQDRPQVAYLNEQAINKVVAEHKGNSLPELGEGFGMMYEYTFGLTPNR